MTARTVGVAFIIAACACGSDSRAPQSPQSSEPLPLATANAPEPRGGTVGAAQAMPDSAAAGTPVRTTTVPSSNAWSEQHPLGATARANPGSADETTNATNTGINDRDRGGTLTPGNQGNSGSETTITAAIRRGVMGDKSLSFAAKNVKIITTGTKVTLRGPVRSDQERVTIETLARQTAGVTDVDDQLEVKAP